MPNSNCIGTDGESVVNDQEKGAAIGSPAASSAPVTVAVYVVSGANAEVGVNVTV